jgi:NAD(P) transhydrogenase
LASGKEIRSESVLYATGRQGATDELGLENVGIEADKRGRIPVDDEFRTTTPHIFAVGDVCGPPGLAAAAMEQGRIATLRAFGQPVHVLPELVPTGVYSIPEIGMVGRTEEELTEAAVPYVAGVSRWGELARGVMTGDESGMLKLLVSTEDRRILGVHAIGTAATELVHIGQAVMGGGSSVDFLVAAVFNYPTFAESYKVAALDAINRL